MLDPSLTSSADFSRLLWALGRCDYTPSPSWLREFVDSSTARLCTLRVRALAELVWALSCWGCHPSPRWLKEFYRASAAKLADAPPQQLAVMVAGLAKLGCRAPEAWTGRALSAFASQLHWAKSHDLVTFLEGLVSVCEDPAWLASQANVLNQLADTAASKFHHLDCISHAKLVLALHSAGCCPGTAWLARQQSALAALLRSSRDSDGSEGAGGSGAGAGGRGGEALLPQSTAADLRDAYARWQVELDTQLAAELNAEASA